MNNYIGALGLAAGAGLVAYCAYFDRKRRNAPDYREKVTARREKEREAYAKLDEEIEIPNPEDKLALEQFFVRQVELGETLLQSNVDRAVEHLCYAIVFCPRPDNLIQYFQEALPTDAYAKMCALLPEVNKKASEVLKKAKSDATTSGIKITEEDVE